jgi:hypothetical protein
MARISVEEGVERRIVIVRGSLTATDLQRLERACGRSLEERRPRLEIVLAGGGIADATAGAYVARLEARGAIVRR